MTETQKNARKVLRNMIKLITGGWCKGSNARDKRGKSVQPVDPSAVRFCFYGALHVADPNLNFDVRDIVTGKVHELAGDNLVHWNDRQRSRMSILKTLQQAHDNIK